MVDAINPQQQTVKDGGVMIPPELYATLPRAFQLGWESLSGPQQQQIVVRASHSLRVNNNDDDDDEEEEEEEDNAHDAPRRPRAAAAAAAAAAVEDEEEDYDLIGRALLTKKGFDPEDLNKRNRGGSTPLNFFCSRGNLSMVRYLVFRRDDYDITARALLTKKGFDPEDLNKRDRSGRTPMIYFSKSGNFKMVRYLHSRDADCRGTDSNGWFPGWFPLVWAAAGGHLEIVRFLSHDGGAHDDIQRQIRFGTHPLRNPLFKDHSPLRIALFKGHFHVAQWLTLNGALEPSRDDIAGGGIDDEIMRRDLRPARYWRYDKRLPLFLWAQDIVTDHDNFQSFVTSTSFTFNGKQLPGELELIAQYVGGTPQQLHTLRQLIDRLGEFIDDVRFVIRGEEDADADADE